jgi:DNA-binding response OmpR family regulator
MLTWFWCTRTVQVLLAEDDRSVRESLTRALTLEGYTVTAVTNGAHALDWLAANQADLVLLDVSMPHVDGLTVCRVVRSEQNRVPILMLTARTETSDRVAGLDAGADDYLPKPFRMEELLARLRALVRRAAGQASPVLRVGDLLLDTRRMQLSRDGLPVHLSPQEYRLVAYLMQHAGRVVPQLELTEQLYAQDFERESNAVEVLVGRVRRKLGAALIETRRGFGYVIEPDDHDTDAPRDAP